MVNEKILNYKPERLYCPLCGQWYDWEGEYLAAHDRWNPYKHKCNKNTIRLWFVGSCICITSSLNCNTGRTLEEYVYLVEVKHDETEPVVKIPLLFYIANMKKYKGIDLKEDESTFKLEFSSLDGCITPNSEEKK